MESHADTLLAAGYNTGVMDGDLSLDSLQQWGFFLRPHQANLTDDVLDLCRSEDIPLPVSEAEALFRAAYERGFRSVATPTLIGAAVREHVRRKWEAWEEYKAVTYPYHACLACGDMAISNWQWEIGERLCTSGEVLPK